MKNLSIQEILANPKDSMIPFIELMERERKSRGIIEEISFDRDRKIPFHEMTGRERNESKIIMIGERPFSIVLALIDKPHDFVEKNIPKLADQLDKLALNFPGALATKYKFITADVTPIINDAAYVRYYATKHVDGPSYSKRWTSKGEEMLYGTGSSISAWPTGIDVSTPPTDVEPGIVERYREVARRIKALKSIYTITDGEYLGIEAGHSTIDPTLAKPYIRWDLVAGGHPELKVVKSVYDAIEFQKNWSDGKGMVALDKTTKPTYDDMSTLPAVGASALWGYQAIYNLNNARTGFFSDVAWITVKGV